MSSISGFAAYRKDPSPDSYLRRPVICNESQRAPVIIFFVAYRHVHPRPGRLFLQPPSRLTHLRSARNGRYATKERPDPVTHRQVHFLRKVEVEANGRERLVMKYCIWLLPNPLGLLHMARILAQTPVRNPIRSRNVQ